MSAPFSCGIVLAHAAQPQNTKTLKAPARVSHDTALRPSRLLLLVSILPSMRRCGPEGEHEERSENCEIGRKMRRETPVLAGVTETAAGDVECANFCCHDRECENQNQRG